MTALAPNPQPNKNIEDINNIKNKENTSNEEQKISEKERTSKRKEEADCPLTDYQRSNQTEDSEWTLMANNKRKNKQRPLKGW